MKKTTMILMLLALCITLSAAAVDSPTLSVPPTVSEITDTQGNVLSGILVHLEYNEHFKAELTKMKDDVLKGKKELDYFALPETELAEITNRNLDPQALSMDDLIHVTVGGYTEKPEDIRFKMQFPVPYEAGTEVVVLMGVGLLPSAEKDGSLTWTVEQAVVNPDGSLTITLEDFPTEPFLLALFS